MFIAAGCSPSGRDYLEAAEGAARWIAASAVEGPNGRTWPAVPGDLRTVGNSLYSGTPGPVLFFLELYAATGEADYLESARSGVDYLLATLPEERFFGLYVGVAGVGFALEEFYRVTREERYREGVELCVDMLRRHAAETGRGIQWSDTTDVISGTAGTGLFLLYLYGQTGDPELLEMAVRAGYRLRELGQPAPGGLKWAMEPNYQRLMPNFSHGTAGIAYFLASLYLETHEPEFLDTAMAGARYLQSIARTEGDSCLIFHHEPDGEDLFYLGWCHGPVGTARLFFRLYAITGETEWMDWVERGARAVLQSGIPGEPHPGFWNNVGVCCGSAGVADFFLSLYHETGKAEYLDFARLLTRQILERAEREDDGLKWTQAEHRSRPDYLQAQTGLMQGAAGIGLWLLRLYAFEQGKDTGIVLPDNPFKNGDSPNSE
jgi:lantibiotic modifying enzyme